MNIYLNYIILAVLGIIGAALVILILSGRRKKSGEGSIPDEILQSIKELKTTDDQTREKELVEINKYDHEIDGEDEALAKCNAEKEKVVKTIQNTLTSVNMEHTRLFASIYNLGLGIVITDKDKNLRFMNKAAKRILEVEKLKNSISVTDVDTLLRKVDVQSKISDAIQSAKSFSYEDVYLDDKLFDVFISPIASKDKNNNETVGAIILLKDKTEERLLKRSKENFFIIASHELRTPLTGIRGYIEIIKNYYFDKIADPEMKRILNDIDASSSRLINIVNDFLDKSKFEEDKISVKLDICDFVPLINSSIQDTNLLAKEKKLFINFENSITRASVLGDRDKIKQILINLISNCIKYSDKGGIIVKLEHTPDEKYKISISDSGNGIPEENVQYLFSKYQQINTKKGANVISTGLGLYISKLLAEKMNGDLKLEQTKIGIGSTFSLSLPIYHDNS